MRPNHLATGLMLLGWAVLYAALLWDHLPGTARAALGIVATMVLVTAHAVRTESDAAPWAAGGTAFATAQVVVLGGIFG